MRRLGGTVLRCIGWGLLTGATAGAAAGVTLLTAVGLTDGTPQLGLVLWPFGTIYGAVIGAGVALVPTIVGTAAVLTALRSRRLGSAGPAEATVRDVLLGLDAGLLIVAGIGRDVALGATEEDVAVWAAAAAALAVTVALLRPAARSIAHGWEGPPEPASVDGTGAPHSHSMVPGGFDVMS